VGAVKRRPGATDDPAGTAGGLDALAERIVSCRACPRLVAWREAAAEAPRPAYAGQRYWARPLPGFGDPRARLLIVGLAPAAHGGNRTGRMFTGDRSGDFLVAALHRAGRANQATSTAADDGLVLNDTYISAALRCAPPANRPEPDEERRCAPYLGEELELLDQVTVVLALGAIAYGALLRQPAFASGPLRRPRFSHGLELAASAVAGGRRRAVTLLCTYHPSQRNVFTGLLDAAMFDAVLGRAHTLVHSG
jgi:uracil-DNA glycosylase family 4